MSVKIRLMRIGAKKRPFYRVVAVDERKKRTGSYIELLGTYNPLTEPHEVILKQDRIDEWIKKGAQPSEGFLRVIGKAPQRPPRKPKKEKKQEVERTKVDGASDKQLAEISEVKSEPVKAVGEVEQSQEAGVSEESGAQQAHNEAQENQPEEQISKPSGALRPDERSGQLEESTPIESESNK